MNNIKAYATNSATDTLKPFTLQRRSPTPHDVVIDIHYCGICHSDIHQARDEWGGSIYPMVPGHEIVGIVSAVGHQVTRFHVGDKVGVGCFVDSCRSCAPCQQKEEQYCEKGFVATYNSRERDGTTFTYGGYSKQIVVDQQYVLTIPDNLNFAEAAPLLCAGITTYSPLKHWQTQVGDRVGVVGLGGLGHMAVKLAKAMGADVTVFSTSDSKRTDATRLGASHFVNTRQSHALDSHANHYKLIINTAAGNTDLNDYLNLLNLNGTMVLVGVPATPNQLHPRPLIMKRRSLAGSLIGGTQETQEMLNFCGKHNITADIEIIPIDQVNEAYERMLKGDIKYRFVIDMSTL